MGSTIWCCPFFVVSLCEIIETYMAIEVIELGQIDDYIYDISLDGTVVNALGCNLLTQTDGCNFSLPKSFRYTEDNPYISTGLNRNTKKGEKYTGLDADVAEFNDLFMRHKNGLGIDEILVSSIQLSRKNYLDLFDDGKVKSVGNTVKSKKMPPYIKKFLSTGVKLLLENKGKEFLDLYYDTIDRIYNRRIPITDIVSIGKIKTSIESYKEKCSTTTSAGIKFPRQAWYELVIQQNKKVDMGDTIYYVNIGDKKNVPDIERVTVYRNQQGEDVTKQMVKEYNEYKKTVVAKKPLSKHLWITSRPGIKDEDVINFNCVLVDIDDAESSNNVHYNVKKYITQFNNRIANLFVVFSKELRDAYKPNGETYNRLIITDPKDRPYIDEEMCDLTSNQPFDEFDQDSYEQVMIPEDKEIAFWISIDKKPPYIEECGLVWEDIVSDYKERIERIDRELREKTIGDFNNTVSSFSKADMDELLLGGRIPEKYKQTYTIDKITKIITHIETNIQVCSLYEILETQEQTLDELSDDTLNV